MTRPLSRTRPALVRNARHSRRVMPGYPKISRALFLIAVILPPAFAAALIFRYGVDLPYSDEWELAPLLVRWVEGSLSLGDVFAPVNGYRQFFPNLLILALARLTHWDARYEMVVSFLLACLTSLGVYRLGRLTLGDDPRRPLAFLLANLFIFSPAQDMNWQMGQQVIFFVPPVCVVACLLIAVSGLGPWARLSLCVCLSTISTFSSANGIVCWLAVFPALFWPGVSGGRRAGRAAAFVWWGCFAVNAALYLYGYQKPPTHPSLAAPLLEPVGGTAFFVSLLGSPLTGQRPSLSFVALCAGAILLAAYAAFCLRLLKRAGGISAAARGLPVWAGLGAYSILTAGVVTLGRAGLGIEQALASRYTTFTLYLTVACVHLALLARRHGGPAREDREARSILAVTPLRVAAAALLCLCAGASFTGVKHIRERRTMLLREKACLMFVDVAGVGCLTGVVYEDPQVLLHRLKMLLAAGCLPPEMARGSGVREFAGESDSSPGNSGTFEGLVKEGELYTATGRATLERRREAPDAVLLAYEDDNGEPVAFALAELEDAAEVLGRFPRLIARSELSWRKSFPAGSLPAPAVSLSAWAFDAETGRAYKLRGTHRLGGGGARAARGSL